MIKSKFKRVTSLFLATLMCVTTFAGIGSTTAYAASGEKADVYMVDFPRDGEDNLVEGVKFHLFGTSLSGDAVDQYAVTDKNGVATFKDVLISGSEPYTLEEVDTAIRYVVPKNQTVPVKWKEVTTRNFNNILKKFTVTVTKSDAEKGEAQGNAKLSGAVYGIYKGETLVDKYVTDENGQFTTKEYVCDTDWTIREITPSEGYLLDKTIHEVGADPKLYEVEHNLTSNDVTEQVIKGNVAIIKHTDDGETKIETPEKGASFEIYLKSAGSYDAANKDERDTIVCDENGFGQTKDMPYGIYTVHQTSGYGTSRINAYKIIEETLNLKDVRIFDYIEDDEGKKKAVLNKKETAIAQSKQEMIKQEFQDWIWSDPERRERLCKSYNEKFNSVRPREYDGSHIIFNGMNPEIELREHQKNAVAHILYGGNTLLAHAVGAGKTFEMVAAAQESKRLGLCNKSLFVVPNHLTEQWAAEYLQLYPAANILVATKKDFETKNRKKFCGRIATGDYDAVIIGHSQFEKIPMSIERQRAILEQQLEEITGGIAELKRNRGENFSIKQLEKSKKSIKQKLDKLNDQTKKDDVVTFEELGVDRLFVDESHYYKNLYLYTKMRNVGGIAQTEAQKSSDLFMKCRYLDEITGGRGTVFATGTPISNSMVELYTIQRYLQYNTLVKNGLQHFDAWASTFGETITAVELTPEGTGYRAKTRFAKFYNLPELMAMFKEIADIKTADMLNLPVPEAKYHNIAVKPSEMQKEMVASLAERAEQVRGGGVDSSVDNMLKITNDGRKLALDQRMLNDMLPDFEGSKINACVDNIYRIWKENADKKSAQLVFCDLSTPKNDGTFSVYNDIRKKLIERGIPESEVKFIHEADTDMKKKELFQKTRKGEVRVLLGSTQKMGAGTNVQDKLIALHDVDCPWRPSDVGRILRTFKIKKNVEVTDNGKDNF